MNTTNVVQMRSQFGNNHTRSRKSDSKANKVATHPQPFDHIKVGDALWVGDPATEYRGREEQVRGYVIVTHTTPTRIVTTRTPQNSGNTKQTFYRNGRKMGDYGNGLLRVATTPEIVDWETARAEERRVREAEEQKQKAEQEALQSMVPKGVGVFDNNNAEYMLMGLSRKQVEVAGAALKAIVN